MELYRRNMFFKLFLFRISYITLLGFTLYLFYTPYSDYAVMTIIILIILSFFSITGIVVNEKSIGITKYYCSGTIAVKRSLSLADRFDIKLFSIHGEVNVDDNFEHDPHWLDLIFAFFPSQTITYKIYKIRVLDNSGGVIKKYWEKLSDKEYELLFEFYLKQNHFKSVNS